MSEGSGTRSEPWTIARLLSWTTDYFTQRELESPRLCAELLLSHALSCRRLDLYTRFDAEPPPAAIDSFRSAVKQAAAGRPIAYLTGRKEFFSLTFEVSPAVLIPRPETEILVERTIHLLRPPRGRGEPADAAAAEPPATPETPRVLDLCTGSGCVAIALARNLPSASIAASDLSADALDVAARNATTHGVHERIDLRLGDLFDPWSDAPPFDVIVANPPYVGEDERADLDPGVRDHEPGLALFAGRDGLDVLRRIAEQAAARLKPAGHLLMEVGYRQADAVRRLLEQAGWRDIVSYRDEQGHARVFHARA